MPERGTEATPRPPQVLCESCSKPNHPWRTLCAWCGKKTVLSDPQEERDDLTF